MYIFGLIGYFGAKTPTPAEPPALARIAGIGLWIGPVLFAFEGMGTALAIFESMGTADPAPFFRVITISYTVRYLCMYLLLINYSLVHEPIQRQTCSALYAID